jgi:hypothetical protein
MAKTKERLGRPYTDRGKVMSEEIGNTTKNYLDSLSADHTLEIRFDEVRKGIGQYYYHTANAEGEALLSPTRGYDFRGLADETSELKKILDDVVEDGSQSIRIIRHETRKSNPLSINYYFLVFTKD